MFEYEDLTVTSDAESRNLYHLHPDSKPCSIRPAILRRDADHQRHVVRCNLTRYRMVVFYLRIVRRRHPVRSVWQ